MQAEEQAKYEQQLESVRHLLLPFCVKLPNARQVRAALEMMYTQRLEEEVARRVAVASSAGVYTDQITDATRVADLIERLFADRPKVSSSLSI